MLGMFWVANCLQTFQSEPSIGWHLAFFSEESSGRFDPNFFTRFVWVLNELPSRRTCWPNSARRFRYFQSSHFINDPLSRSILAVLYLIAARLIDRIYRTAVCEAQACSRPDRVSNHRNSRHSPMERFQWKLSIKTAWQQLTRSRSCQMLVVGNRPESARFDDWICNLVSNH